MRIVLVAPDSVDLSSVCPTRTLLKSASQLPLGLLYVAAATEAAGHQVFVLDNYLDVLPAEEVAERVLSLEADCVGFSTTIMNIWQGFSLAARIKAEQPAILTVFGGPQPTIDPYGTIQNEGVDCVVRGEGERIFVDLLTAFSHGYDAMASVPGVLLKWADGTIVEGPAPDAISSLAGMPWPARHLVNLNRYERIGNGLLVHPVDVMATSRGCCFQCAFCSSAEYWNRKYRTRPAVEVVDEMQHMVEDYGTNGFYFREDNFTVNRTHVLNLCDEIERRGLNVVWECESRVDTLSRDTMARMVDAGCRSIWCGVESGSQRILDSVCKGTRVEQALAFYRMARKLGVRTGASFMLGIPGETEADVELSLRLAREIDADWVGFLSYVALPGSPLYRHVCQEGLYAGAWESIRFVETEYLSLDRVLDLEKRLNRTLRWHKVARRPIRSILSMVRRRLNRRQRRIGTRR